MWLLNDPSYFHNQQTYQIDVSILLIAVFFPTVRNALVSLKVFYSCFHLKTLESCCLRSLKGLRARTAGASWAIPREVAPAVPPRRRRRPTPRRAQRSRRAETKAAKNEKSCNYLPSLDAWTAAHITFALRGRCGGRGAAESCPMIVWRVREPLGRWAGGRRSTSR